MTSTAHFETLVDQRVIGNIVDLQCAAKSIQRYVRIGLPQILLDRGWGKAKETYAHSGPDSTPIKKIVREIVYMPPPGEIESIGDMPQPPLEITFVRSNGNGRGHRAQNTHW
jgi:hypothetical protein